MQFFDLQFNGTPHPNPSPEKEGRYMVLEAPLIKERGWGEVSSQTSKNSFGALPVNFLKDRLKVAFELNPQSKAMPRSVIFLFSGN
jgi:hypothetical protein